MLELDEMEIFIEEYQMQSGTNYESVFRYIVTEAYLLFIKSFVNDSQALECLYERYVPTPLAELSHSQRLGQST